VEWKLKLLAHACQALKAEKLQQRSKQAGWNGDKLYVAPSKGGLVIIPMVDTCSVWEIVVHLFFVKNRLLKQH
jgi:hypothetical protein